MAANPRWGPVVDGDVMLSSPGLIVQNIWRNLPQHFANVILDEFMIMPNHVHGIIIITDEPRRGEARVDPGRGRSGDGTIKASPSTDLPLRADHGRGLPEIIRAFKSFSARRINTIQNTPGLPFWQRNYYEHIIRSENELQKIRQYIRDNRLRWELDTESP